MKRILEIILIDTGIIKRKISFGKIEKSEGLTEVPARSPAVSADNAN